MNCMMFLSKYKRCSIICPETNIRFHMFHPNRSGRQWVYDDKVSEYYVILEDKGTLKKRKKQRRLTKPTWATLNINCMPAFTVEIS